MPPVTRIRKEAPVKLDPHRTLHTLRTFVFVLWWMAVAFAGVFVFYLMTRPAPG
jgi:hypothetical protein